MKRINKSVVRIALPLALLIALGFFVLGGPVRDITASPLEQQATTGIWFDQTITTAGVYGCVDSGTSNQWTAFLHIDTPAVTESYTVTVYQRAIVGTTIYTGPVELTYSVHETTTAQNYMTHTAYTDGEIWPSHCVRVNTRNASQVADLLWLQGR